MQVQLFAVPDFYRVSMRGSLGDHPACSSQSQLFVLKICLFRFNILNAINVGFGKFGLSSNTFRSFGCSQYLRRVLSVVIWLRPIQRTDINERCLMKFSDLVLESTYLKCVHIRTPRKSQLSSLFFMFSQPTVLVFNDLRHEALYTASDEALFSPSLVWLVSYTRAPAFMVLSEAWSALLPFRRTVERCAAPAHGRAVRGSFDRASQYRSSCWAATSCSARPQGRATGHARPHAGLTGSGVAGRTDTNGPKGP